MKIVNHFISSLMKKTFILSMLIAVFAIAFTSCTAGNKLEASCVIANKQMPQQVDNGVTMESVEYIDGDVVYTCEVNENISPATVSDLESAQDVMKDAMIQTMRYGDSDTRELVKLVKEANANIKFIYKGHPSGDQFTITVHPSEI